MNATYTSQPQQLTNNETNTAYECDHNDWASLLQEFEGIADLTTIAAFTNQSDPALLQRVAESAHVSARTLMMLASNPYVEVRCAVADNTKTPSMALLMLAQDECEDVRYQLAENHNVPDHVLCFLIDDGNPFVSCRAGTTLARKQREQLSFAA